MVLGLGLFQGEDDHRQVHVGHRRTDEQILPGLDGHHGVLLPLPLQGHEVPHRGGDVLVAEQADGLGLQ